METKVLLLLGAVVASGCEIERCPEEAPTLEFYRYEYVAVDPTEPTSTDTLKLIFQFEDCQGDVGIPAADNTKNLQTELYQMIDGAWVKYEPQDSAIQNILYAQVPETKKLKKNQRVEGVVEQPINSPKQYGDTIRFETVLMDVLGNRSERLVTPEYVLP